MRIEVDCFGCRLRDGEKIIAQNGDYDHVDEILRIAEEMGVKVEQNSYPVAVDLVDDDCNRWTKIHYGPEYRMPHEIGQDCLEQERERLGDEYIEVEDVYSP